MKRIIVLHFNPIELYPPVQNLLGEMSKAKTYKTIAVSTCSGKQALELFCVEEIRILRFGLSGKYLSKSIRYATYLYYNLFATLLLVLKRPSKVIYFETLSSYPAYLYKKYINRNAKIFVHYHEYTSKEEYVNGMVTSKFFHQLEMKLYPKIAWVSHTNEERMKLFLDNIAPVQIPQYHILPNYPPLSWNSSRKKDKNIPLRLVYIGSLGMKSMFIEEFTHWVTAQNGKVIWDIYSVVHDQDVLDYFKAINNPHIHFKTGVSYKELPDILQQYDVGIILYNGRIPNHVHAAPNKLFEYLACGLDVWFPDVITGSLPYTSLDTTPKAIPLDFNNLKNIELNDLLLKSEHQYPNHYFAEKALEPLLQRLES